MIRRGRFCRVTNRLRSTIRHGGKMLEIGRFWGNFRDESWNQTIRHAQIFSKSAVFGVTNRDES